ncbi:MAG: SDR family NAD(P)-dependent oxidoreductase [Fimbriimonas sp.]
MLLKDKVAVIYGAGGSIGGAVARAFAREGARVFLSGRNLEKVRPLAEEIAAEAAEVDATDEGAVDAFVASVVAKAGRVDVSFNLIGYGDVQEPLMEISVDDFLQPIVTAMRSHFLTTRAAARSMIRQGSGVVLTFGGGGPQTEAGLGGFKVALDAIEGLRRQWALELGTQGIRVVTLKTGGILESIADDFEAKGEIERAIVGQTLLKRAATLEDVGNVAVFVASDWGRTLTSTEVNLSCGGIVD